jgi:hypothetical protein
MTTVGIRQFNYVVDKQQTRGARRVKRDVELDHKHESPIL